MENVIYNTNPINQTSANFNQTPMNGGYPYGYPPVVMPPQYVGGPVNNPYLSQYSPYIDPNMQQQVPQYNGYVPGSVAPVEVQDSSGNVMKVQPSTGYNPGGATISQGGFNPVSGVSNQVVCGSGFNPYGRFIGNPGYVPNANNPYAGYNQQYMAPYGYNGYQQQGYYPQNQFDTYMQDILYQETPSMFDVKEMLERVVLTDAERQKIDHNRNCIIGTDYYGRPIYSQTAYQANQQRQSEFEQARKQYQSYFTKLAKIAHAFSGEEIDEEKTMKRFDPVPKQEYQKPFDYYSATEEERNQYNRDLMVARTRELENRLNNQEYINAQTAARKAQAFAQIKASHDKLIGVEPGQHYDLKTFMENGYKIGVNAEIERAKAANRNGTTKYSQNGYRASLSQRTNSPVPVESKDDEYVSIETILKGVFDRNRQQLRNGIFQNANGQTTYTSMAASPSEGQAHTDFLKAMEQKRGIDNMQRMVM